jgi:hypothetical protein
MIHGFLTRFRRKASGTRTPVERARSVRPRRSRWAWPRRAAFWALSLALCAVLAIALALRLADTGDPAAAGRTRGADALWLGHAWVDGRHSAAEIAALADELRDTGIRELYVHTGPLAADGTLDPARYPAAGAFLTAIRRDLPGVSVQAWLGDVVAHGGTGGLRLDDPATRARIRRSVAQALDAGFDGVHLDLEPVVSGDPGYLTLLTGVHDLTSARGGTLSVAAPQIDPLPGLHALAATLANHPKWWSQHYFGQVARRTDQIAVMAYDTGMPSTAMFSGYVARQTALAVAATPKSVLLQIGLPAYHTDAIGHHASAETVAAAVRGARLGLARTDPARARFGLALYVDFTATARDWAAYRSGWGGSWLKR